MVLLLFFLCDLRRRPRASIYRTVDPALQYLEFALIMGEPPEYDQYRHDADVANLQLVEVLDFLRNQWIHSGF